MPSVVPVLVVGGWTLTLLSVPILVISRLLLAILIIDHDRRSRSTIRDRSAAESATSPCDRINLSARVLHGSVDHGPLLIKAAPE